MNIFDDLKTVDINHPSEWPKSFIITLSLFICALIFIGGWNFIIKEQNKILKLEQMREQELRRTFLVKKGLVINLPAYQKQMIKIEQMLLEMVEQLPDDTEVPSLLIDITEAGSRRGLDFLVFDPQSEDIDDFYAVLPIRVEVKGSFEQLAGFISDLASMPRIVTVGDMSVKADEDGLLKTSLIIHTYRYLSKDV